MKRRVTYNHTDQCQLPYAWAQKILQIIHGYNRYWHESLLYNVDFNSVISFAKPYLPDRGGVKVTTYLSGLLRNFEISSSTWAVVANKISQLYLHYDDVVIARWRNKKLIGNGIYEPNPTCFSWGKSNYDSKIFCVKYDRIKFLTLDCKKGRWKARGLVYFSPNNKVYLLNTYYVNTHYNPDILTTAISKLLGVEFKVTRYLSGDDEDRFALPIYINDYYWELQSDNYKCNPRLSKLLPCPHCDKKTASKNYIHTIQDSRHYLGCSPECAWHTYPKCFSCGIRVPAIATSPLIRYCEACTTRNLMNFAPPRWDGQGVPITAETIIAAANAW